MFFLKKKIVWVVKVLAWWSFIPCQILSFYTHFAQNAFTVVSQDQITQAVNDASPFNLLQLIFFAVCSEPE